MCIKIITVFVIMIGSLKESNTPPLRLIALANLMKLEFDMFDITCNELSDKISHALYLMV